MSPLTMPTPPVLLERRGAVGWITLNRPEAGNALDLAATAALFQAAIACDEDATLRCVVLTGAGRMFCAGGDIREFAAHADHLGTTIKQLTLHLHGAVSRLARMAKPLITCINGPAAGAGLALALLGDIALAAASAKFAAGYPGIGLSPDGGATWLLPRVVGLRRAQEILLLNAPLGAEQAAAIGLVTRVVADAGLLAETESLALKLAAGPTGALGRTRALLLSSAETGLDQQMALEAHAVAASGTGSDGREGIAAFLEKRQPAFVG
jgi:2-(1,2-epoxy-1,2-dihydrophenyl)acetyl-CoA isomerase